MSLHAGQDLAHYRILEKIGAGGMGEVWLAEDTRLKRKVALKVLPAWTAGDADRRARFEREAQAVAALNHPNIVTIHSVEAAEGIPFLTMEHIEGRKLGALIPEGGLPIDRLLALSIPLADAVASAHDHGIIHRDLKPDNVMITDGGAVKVLDFGLAKLREEGSDAEGSETQLPTATLTEQGSILGTAQYMSPEQAEGKPVGPGSDVFSLGIILYEMATGARPFTGDTPISTISSILRDDPPPVTEVRRALPRQLGRIVRRCLAKDPARRYASARGLRNELEMLRDEVARGEPELEGAPASIAGVSPSWRVAAYALLGMAALLALWAGVRGRPAAPAAVGGAPRPRVSHQTFYAGVESFPSLSPDGAFLAYSGDRDDGGGPDIFLERVGGRNPLNLTASADAVETMPAFSPDGSRIAFRSSRGGGGIFVMGATGESHRRLTDAGFDPAWSADGTRIAYATEGAFDPASRNRMSALWVVDVASGEAREILEGDAMQPSWSPTGRRIAYWTAYSGSGEAGQRDVWTVRADGSDPVPVTQDVPLDWSPVWARDGHLYFCSDRGGSMNLWRVRVDEDSGETLTPPEPVTVPSGHAGPISLSADGRRLAYVALESRSNIQRMEFDPATGTRGAPQPVTRGSLEVLGFRLSPKGEWIVFATRDVQEDLYLARADGTGLRKLIDDVHKDRGPSFLPDGKKVIFYSSRAGGYELWTVDLESGDLRQVTDSTTENRLWFPEVSPDGRTVAAFNASGTVLLDLGGELPLDQAEGRRLPGFGDDSLPFLAPRWSPDGKLLLGRVPGKGGVIYDVAAGEYRELTAPTGEPAFAAWMPDGALFAGAGEQLYRVDLAKGTWHELDTEPVEDATEGPEFGPDGRTAFFIVSTVEADVWIADLE